jgi:hypothetical protein
MVNPLATLRQTKLRIDKVENASVPPNTERTLCNHTGPGVVVSLWMALGGGNAPALDGRLRVYYDGSPSAAIDIDMGTLLATHWGAGSANTSHSCEHVHVEINSGNYLTAFLVTFPIPFGTSIRMAYFNINAGQTANVYSMVTYSLTPTDEANGQRLRYQGVRYVDQRVTRTATSTTTLAQITGARARSSTTPTSQGSGPATFPGWSATSRSPSTASRPRRSSPPERRTGSTAAGTSRADATTTPASTATSAPTNRAAT